MTPSMGRKLVVSGAKSKEHEEALREETVEAREAREPRSAPAQAPAAAPAAVAAAPAPAPEPAPVAEVEAAPLIVEEAPAAPAPVAQNDDEQQPHA